MIHDTYLETPDDEGEGFGSVGGHDLAALHGEAVVSLLLTCQVWGGWGKDAGYTSFFLAGPYSY